MQETLDRTDELDIGSWLWRPTLGRRCQLGPAVTSVCTIPAALMVSTETIHAVLGLAFLAVWFMAGDIVLHDRY